MSGFGDAVGEHCPVVPRCSAMCTAGNKCVPVARKVGVVGILMTLCALMACGAGPDSLNVSLEADARANQNTPVAVAVLVVYDKDIAREFSKKKAAIWFAEMEQQLRDNPDMSKFDLRKWEVMPGQRISEFKMPLQGRTVEGAYVFADYLQDLADKDMNDYRFSFKAERDLVIILGEREFRLVRR